MSENTDIEIASESVAVVNLTVPLLTERLIRIHDELLSIKKDANYEDWSCSVGYAANQLKVAIGQLVTRTE